MDVKRLIAQFTYRIEPKPEGGFVAHASDPTAPPLEAATREELQRKIQATINAALVAQFPRLKQPLENNNVKFSFHVEQHPGGGFSIQSTDGNQLPIIGGTHAEIENHFVERLGGLIGKLLMPEFAQALANPPSGDVQVLVNRTEAVSTRTPGALGAGQSFTSDSIAAGNANNVGMLDPGASQVLPEKSSLWTILRFFLAVLALGALTYFFRLRH
jgi:hypothetical protein